MKKSDEIRHDQELAEQARPIILRELRAGEEPLAISRVVAKQLAVDETKAYRWTAYIAEAFEQSRKRWGLLGLLLLWPGMIVLVGGGVLWLLGAGEPVLPFWLLGMIIGAPLTAAGATVLALRRRLARIRL